MKTTNPNYSANIEFASKTLTAKEKVMLKDTTNALSLDNLTQPKPIMDGDKQVGMEPQSVVIDPDFYAVLAVHNEKAKDKDYKKYIIVDKAGNKYITGSESLMRSFVDIMDEMKDSDEEFQVEVYRMPSKNFQGRDFLTCSIV